MELWNCKFGHIWGQADVGGIVFYKHQLYSFFIYFRAGYGKDTGIQDQDAVFHLQYINRDLSETYITILPSDVRGSYNLGHWSGRILLVYLPFLCNNSVEQIRPFFFFFFCFTDSSDLNFGHFQKKKKKFVLFFFPPMCIPVKIKK